MEIPKKWSSFLVIKNANKIYNDVDIYFLEDIPYFKYAEDLYNSVKMAQVDIPMSVEEMLKEG